MVIDSDEKGRYSFFNQENRWSETIKFILSYPEPMFPSTEIWKTFENIEKFINFGPNDSTVNFFLYLLGDSIDWECVLQWSLTDEEMSNERVGTKTGNEHDIRLVMIDRFLSFVC